MNIAELVPTEELVDLFNQCLGSKCNLLKRITSHMIIYSDWALLFTLSPAFSSTPVLLKACFWVIFAFQTLAYVSGLSHLRNTRKTILFIASEDYPIEKVESANIQLRAWQEFDWSQVTNDQLAEIFTDFSTGLSIDSFIHPSSCHIISLNLVKSVCLRLVFSFEMISSLKGLYLIVHNLAVRTL